MIQNTTWTVFEKKTGKKICECAQETDAIRLILLGNYERGYRKTQYLVEQTIDVSYSGIKELSGQLGLPSSKIALQENHQEPFIP